VRPSAFAVFRLRVVPAYSITKSVFSANGAPNITRAALVGDPKSPVYGYFISASQAPGRSLAIKAPATWAECARMTSGRLAVNSLCTCSERAGHSGAANKANKFAPSHCPSQAQRSGIVAGQTGGLEMVRLALGRCPLWVKSRHQRMSASCPLYPQ
jgi:hypothetical protein